MEKQLCECCGQKIRKPRVIVVTKALVHALGIAYEHCKSKNTKELQIGDIRDKLTHGQYCRFNDWIRLSSGMVYRGSKKHSYGLNFTRVEDFFRGRWPVHDVTIDPINKEQTNGPEYTIGRVKGVFEMLDDNGYFMVEYKERT